MKRVIGSYDINKELTIIFRYRSWIMAVSIIFIVLFHSAIEANNSVTRFLIQVGYGGVDIFFFLSGIGVWHSLEKNNDKLSFYKRRLQRLFPAYVPFIIIWFWGIRFDGTYEGGGLSLYIQAVQDFLGNIIMLGWINGLENQFNWYIQALLWFYFIAPFFYAIVKKNNWCNIVLFLVLYCMIIASFDKEILMATSRLPIFFLGILLAEWADQNKKVRGIIVYGLMLI